MRREVAESWRVFLIKAIILFFILLLCWYCFQLRYLIVYDSQSLRCIPEYKIYLVDKKDKTITRNNLYMFLSNDLSPLYPNNTKMLKYLRGIPYDQVEINSMNQIYIDGKLITQGLALAQKKLNLSEFVFHGKKTLKNNEYWFLGTSLHSFDSRYWGSVGFEKIVGRAYPLY